jgi:hypothetical protein
VVPTKPGSKNETTGTNGVKIGVVEGGAWTTRAGEWLENGRRVAARGGYSGREYFDNGRSEVSDLDDGERQRWQQDKNSGVTAREKIKLGFLT